MIILIYVRLFFLCLFLSFFQTLSVVMMDLRLLFFQLQYPFLGPRIVDPPGLITAAPLNSCIMSLKGISIVPIRGAILFSAVLCYTVTY